MIRHCSKVVDLVAFYYTATTYSYYKIIRVRVPFSVVCYLEDYYFWSESLLLHGYIAFENQFFPWHMAKWLAFTPFEQLLFRRVFDFAKT